MKRILQLLSLASAASLLASTAAAQDTTTTRKMDRMDNARRWDRINAAAKAGDLIGLEVKNYQGVKLGKIEDLAVDVESGRIVNVILSTGGFAGVGDTLHAVPPGALHHDVANKVVHLDADKAKLTASPKFEMSKWDMCCDSNHVSEVYTHYGEQPYFVFLHKGDNQNTVATRNADGTWNKDRMAGENMSWSRLGYVQRASKLDGTWVRNLQDEKLGKVESLMCDLSAGRIVAVVISSGGFLGMGDELSAVPPTALHYNADRSILQLDASKDMLASAPHFKSSEWPDFGQPMYAHGVYRAYKVEPYFTTNAVAEADNTRRNVRDRNNNTLTPLDQGSSKSDTEMTAQIRKGIMARDNVSVNAKNVKIMTIDGRVTLRGPVDSAEEKRVIGEIANSVARTENVNNQLEVK